jgi:hypothetical protein
MSPPLRAFRLVSVLSLALAAACSSEESTDPGGESGASQTGGTPGAGGSAGHGGSSAAGKGGSPQAGHGGQSGKGQSGGNAASGQAGSGTAGKGNAGSGQAGSSQAGNGNAGSSQAGSGQAGSGNAGSGNAGSGNAGSGNAGSGNAGSGNAGSGNAGSGNAGSGQAGSGQAGSGQSGSGQGGSGPGAPFRFGINMGYFTSKIDDTASATMARKAGANSIRVDLPDSYLQTWGDGIELGDMNNYAGLGMHDHVAMLLSPPAEHSNAPPGTPDWQFAQYSPKNLYEPIFLADGTVNPQNYWAAYIARVVQTYSAWVRTYEVWNEPDQVGGNWQATGAWETDPPKPSDLIWWNDSIFAYIRMLRITHEVVHKLDPSGKVALGGIGYGSYLSALMRYTDEPSAGAVSADYPARGGDYFDVISYHYYPLFTPGNSDAAAAGLIAAHDDYEARRVKAGVGPRPYVVTESGAPRFAFGTQPGGPEYSRNYLIKAMTLAHGAGLMGVDWFLLGDGKPVGQSTDPFDYMGLYFNYSDAQSTADLEITDTGVAYATLGQLLDGSLSDPDATAALQLGPDVGGAAFRLSSGKPAYVLWARAATDENGQATYTLSAPSPLTEHAWDWSRTGATTAHPAGPVPLTLGSAPLILTGD